MAVQAALIALLLDKEEENKCIKIKKRMVWSWIKNRQESGAFRSFHKELELKQQTFKEYFRVTKTHLKTLLKYTEGI